MRRRLSPRERLWHVWIGLTFGGAGAWATWRLVEAGEVMLAVAVSGFIVLGVLALGSALRG